MSSEKESDKVSAEKECIDVLKGVTLDLIYLRIFILDMLSQLVPFLLELEKNYEFNLAEVKELFEDMRGFAL